MSWKKKQIFLREQSPWKTLVTYLLLRPLYENKPVPVWQDPKGMAWSLNKVFAHIQLQTLLCYNSALNFTSRDWLDKNNRGLLWDKKSAKWNFFFIRFRNPDRQQIHFWGTEFEDEPSLYCYSLQAHHLISECGPVANKFRQRTAQELVKQLWMKPTRNHRVQLWGRTVIGKSCKWFLGWFQWSRC